MKKKDKKKKKMKLEDLKAESFVTKLDEPGADTVKGGALADDLEAYARETMQVKQTAELTYVGIKIDPKRTI